MRAKTCSILKMLCIRLTVRVQKESIFLFIHPVCLPVCALSSPRKRSSNVVILTYGIQVHYNRFRIENNACKIDYSCKEKHKRITIHNGQ